MVNIQHDFNRNVFINCPFDDRYKTLFKAIVFVVHDTGFKPRCALEISNSMQNRLVKIMDLIAGCKYSIHDLSRTELDPAFHLPRFNMPLELGIDLGCRNFGNRHQKQKACLVLDRERYRYQKFISDISGQDVEAHNDQEEKVIEIIRDWLQQILDPRIIQVPGAAQVFQRYSEFQKSLPSLCEKLKWDSVKLPFVDFSFTIATWISLNPI